MSRQRRRRWLLTVLTGAVVVTGGIFAGWHYMQPKLVTYTAENGTEMKFKTDGDRFMEYGPDGTWREMFVKGVNLGATSPGHYPGEFPLTKEDYLRWFQQIEDLGANVIRVYTVHEPIFYSALVEYNRGREQPLYFIQGIWSPEEELIEKQDAYAAHIEQTFKQEIEKAVSAVYGDANIPAKQGESSGKYKTNAGKYLMAWHVGTEWDPAMVDNTNAKHADVPQYKGVHFSASPEASPFENWLAELLDHTAVLEKKYGWEHPMTFTNWVTTDVLDHPGEPLYEEDLVSVDARHIQPEAWQGGYFAAYHVYPYYPDLFHIDQTLQTIKDENGEYNTYKSYLRKLKAEFSDMPVMITEYGVPSSLGISHLGMGGRNQGGHNEVEQGDIDASLTQDIYDEGYSGAIVFMWQDEWFKKTWNTMPLEIPADRRAYWLNVLTNEKMFGLLAMDPGKQEQLTIDGSLDDWDDLKDEEVKTWQGQVDGIQEMKMTHDEAYLYIGLTLDQPFDPEKTVLRIGTDTLAGGSLPDKLLPGRTLSDGLETVITLGQDEESQVEIAKDYDFNQRLYGKEGYDMLPDQQSDSADPFHPWNLAVSLRMTPPDTRSAQPFMNEKVGTLKRGTTAPGQPDTDSLTAWQYNGNQVEMRIPWMLLGFGDPSSLQAIDYGPLKNGREFSTVAVEGVALIPWLTDRATKNVSWPGGEQTTLDLKTLPVYSWQPWEQVQYSERLKLSYEKMKKSYEKIPSFKIE
ncbi:hypothetical protein [Paenibacillus xylanexedens]|uniref:Family 2 glycosyl transferase n=1 Tax=Paenibacillus xylanexedens TaxID=528191 RepID=A0ABS4S1Y6_PAEXY|nr:hypothetical protein [Paenibacillus xylanexedens]MBP2248640.1 hypothetical protein [Paenibacillus xylanexedens]